jgi:uncharacterized protein
VLKVSQFTVVRSLAPWDLPGENLVFNTETGRSLTVSEAHWRALLDHLDRPHQAPPALGDALRTLTGEGYFVSREDEESRRFLASFETARRAPRRILPLVAVTSACNIACTYCYEEGIASRHMSDETVDATVRWMERRVVEDGIGWISPGLFGGEPLMRPRTLLRFMDAFNEMIERHGARGGFYCSSNGMLLTDRLAADLAARGLEQIQISLDGPEEIHDLRRRGHRGQPSFQQSLVAIHTAVEHVPQVTVKVNFDRQNIPFVEELFDQLLAAGLGRRVEVKLEAIAHQMPDSTVAHDARFPIPPESADLANAYNVLTLQAQERGIRVASGTAHTTPCMLTSEHGVLIGPDGQIYKCISLIGRPDMAVGSVHEDDYDRDAYEAQMDVRKRTEDCVRERCSYLPVCAGGCAYESVVRTGRQGLRFCTKGSLAEYHFKRHLVRHRAALTRLGMRPLRADDFPVDLADAPVPERGAPDSGCGGACGSPGGSASAAFVPMSALSVRRA